MSDVMPYTSSVWSSLGTPELEAWRSAWRRAIAAALDAERPDVVHVHHAWLGAALVREAAEVPVVLHGHGTGLRQMVLTPSLHDEVVAACSQVDALCALHGDHAARYRDALGLAPELVHVVGAGYAAERFGPDPAPADPDTLLFVGKWSEAKGLGPLLEAFERVRARRPGAVLRLAGGGAGPEAERLRERAAAQPGVEVLGRLSDAELVRAMQRAQASSCPRSGRAPARPRRGAAAGCRLVVTALPGVLDALAEPPRHACLVPRRGSRGRIGSPPGRAPPSSPTSRRGSSRYSRRVRHLRRPRRSSLRSLGTRSRAASRRRGGRRSAVAEHATRVRVDPEDRGRLGGVGAAAAGGRITPSLRTERRWTTSSWSSSRCRPRSGTRPRSSRAGWGRSAAGLRSRAGAARSRPRVPPRWAGPGDDRPSSARAAAP